MVLAGLTAFTGIGGYLAFVAALYLFLRSMIPAELALLILGAVHIGIASALALALRKVSE